MDLTAYSDGYDAYWMFNKPQSDNPFKDRPSTDAEQWAWDAGWEEAWIDKNEK